MHSLTIPSLRSGGVITNLYCSSACKHCLYASSPKWDKDYISAEMTEGVIKKILDLGCHSIHIGGGEPMLNLVALKQFLTTARNNHLTVEYIETNSSWYQDQTRTVRVLEELQYLGVDTLLISISPFHNEYIPFAKVNGLIEACRVSGMGMFLWLREFMEDITAFSLDKPHSLTEYAMRYGDDYLQNVAKRFPLNLRGRALLTYQDIYPKRTLEQILTGSKSGCSELANTSHFHIDLYGNYIPGLCSGLAISVDDLGEPINANTYPYLQTLYSEGINGFLAIAKSDYHFVPKEHYISKCHLCFDIRRYLVIDQKVRTDDLKPVAYYQWI